MGKASKRKQGKGSRTGFSQRGGELIERMGETARDRMNDLIGELLELLPDDGQARVDGLRGVHRALAYHIGTVEHLILMGFGADASPEIVKNLETDRRLGIDEGYGHGRFHETGSSEGN